MKKICDLKIFSPADGAFLSGNPRYRALINGNLEIRHITNGEAGIYICHVNDEFTISAAVRVLGKSLCPRSKIK